MLSRLKVIHDPLQGVVNIKGIQPMVDAAPFQRLRELRQLSFTDLAFPAARHSRFEHSIGSYETTRHVTNNWMAKQGSIDGAMRRALMGFALYHDIGHPAFSHATEDFCGDHKVRTLQIIDDLRPEIESCDIDFGLMRSLAAHKNPLHLAVSDKNVGLEKLDYLERDGWYTGVGKPTGVLYLREFMYVVGDKIAVDEKMVDHAIHTMNFYMEMYKNVYLRKCLVIAQRMFHKLLHYLVQTGELEPMRLFEMNDAELLGFVALSKHPGVRRLYQRLRQRQLLKEAVSIRPEALIAETRVVGKAISVRGLSAETLLSFAESPRLQKHQHSHLQKVEETIAFLLGIDETDVVFVPAFYANRFKSSDVNVCQSDGTIGSLRERRPDAFRSMEETARTHQVMRVCVPEYHRKRAANAASDIVRILMEAA